MITEKENEKASFIAEANACAGFIRCCQQLLSELQNRED